MLKAIPDLVLYNLRNVACTVKVAASPSTASASTVVASRYQVLEYEVLLPTISLVVVD